MARTPSPIDWKLVDDYLEVGATQEEIAESFGIHRDAFRKRFKDKYNIEYVAYSAQFKRQGQMKIRRSQFDNAVAGNTQLLLWLGKILCDQRETEREPDKAPNQDNLSLAQRNMELEHELARYKASNADNEPEAE